MVSTTTAGSRRDAELDHDGDETSADAPDVPVGWIAAAVLVAMLVAFLLVTRRRDGDFTYPLDDSYIHLRLGSNLARGTLGMNPGEFASASSSPIWPVLIAAVAFVTGPLVGIPLVLATLAAVVTLVLLDRWARARGHSITERAALMAGMVLVVPLTAVALTGMEHALQVGGVLLLVGLVVDRVAGSDPPGPDQVTDAEHPDDAVTDRADGRADLAILGAAALCAATRLEAVFVLVPLAVLVVAHRRWRTLWALAVGGVVPVAALAVIDLGQGWPALPASVLVKAGLVDRADGPAALLVVQTRLLVVMCLALLLCWWGRRALGDAWSRQAVWWTAIAWCATLLNLAAGLIVQVHRYEAYLVALCVMACAVDAHALRAAQRRRSDAVPMSLPFRGLVAALAVAALAFGLATLPDMSNAVQEIHLQQAQMARFAASACPGCTVVVNDIGKVSLDGDVRIVDDVGLANLDVLDSTRAGTYDSRRLDEIAVSEGATFAMVYPDWYPAPPDRWERVGSWRLADTQVVGGDEVVVYSLDPSRTDELRRAFREFEMPPEVLVTPAP